MNQRYNYTSINTILARFNRNLKDNSVSEMDLIEWIGEAMGFMKMPEIQEEAVAFMIVENHQCDIPQGLQAVIQIAKNRYWQEEDCLDVCKTECSQEIEKRFVTETVCEALPDPPLIITGELTAPTIYTITITPLPGALTYRIYKYDKVFGDINSPIFLGQEAHTGLPITFDDTDALVGTWGYFVIAEDEILYQVRSNELELVIEDLFMTSDFDLTVEQQAPPLILGETNTNLDLDWTDVSGAVLYEIYQNGILVDSTVSSDAVDDRLKLPGVVYNYQIKAFDVLGRTRLSNIVPFAFDTITVNITGTFVLGNNFVLNDNPDLTLTYTP